VHGWLRIWDYSELRRIWKEVVLVWLKVLSQCLPEETEEKQVTSVNITCVHRNLNRTPPKIAVGCTNSISDCYNKSWDICQWVKWIRTAGRGFDSWQRCACISSAQVRLTGVGTVPGLLWHSFTGIERQEREGSHSLPLVPLRMRGASPHSRGNIIPELGPTSRSAQGLQVMQGGARYNGTLRYVHRLWLWWHMARDASCQFLHVNVT
jgi:hypothetical protein